MKLPILLLLALFILQEGTAQNTDPRPTRSRFYNNRFKGFPVKAGDIYVYNINKDSMSFDLLVTVNKHANVVDLSYSIKDLGKTGTITLSEASLKDAYIYDTLITDSVKPLTDVSVFWLSKKNFMELYSIKQTQMDLGNGKELFVRKNTQAMKFRYKGKERLITLYNIENNSQNPKKYLSVLTDQDNPVILKMDVGWTMTLKEVR